MASLSQGDGGGRYNKINIILMPDPTYIISYPDAKLPVVKLIPQQIQKVEILKGYIGKVTDVYVTFANVDSGNMADLRNGKYIMYLFISGSGPSAQSRLNYFVCDDMQITQVSENLDGYPLISTYSKFKSVTRKRLEVENAFSYYLGGKGIGAGFSAQGSGKTPYAFFNDEFQKLYYELYADRGVESTSSSIISTQFTTADSDTKVSTPVSGGFIIDSPNNLSCFEYFLEHYPIFRTKTKWMLDDFNTFSTYGPSCVFISDLIRWDSWKRSLSSTTSKLDKFFNPKENQSNADNSLGMAVILGGNLTDYSPQYNSFNFEVRDSSPLIYATDIATQSPILTPNWNTLHKYRYAPVNSSTGYSLKKIKNPLFKEYLTFMNPLEISMVQAYTNVYQNLHPALITYTFDNLLIGEVDLHTVVEIRQASLDKSENHGYDRIGLGYQVKHTYDQSTLHPKYSEVSPGSISDDDVLNNPEFTPSYILTTEITFLFIDEGAKTLQEYVNLNVPMVNKESTITSADLVNMVSSGCAPGSGGSVAGGDGGGIPGNTSIADQGQSLVDAGFVYKFGGTSSKAMDCSAFTQKAVQLSGADKGYSSRYPRSTSGQYPWCVKNAIPIDFEHRQRGDIVFFSSHRSSGVTLEHGHTGIFSGKDTVLEASSSRGKGVNRNLGKRKVTGIFRIVPKGTTAKKSTTGATT